MMLMGMVDSKYRFFIFQSTDLWNQIKNQDYLPKIGKKVGSLLEPPLILGDAAFPLQQRNNLHYNKDITTTG